ncbi:MAG: WGR domain-containing protein [Sulfurovaceae bacterium]|nr:WGR domain-containing protein [Sulfurovaceae bacterium]
MLETITRKYLELSSETDTVHKFYEVCVDGCEMTIRYGRIGTDGTKSSKMLDTPEKAEAEAKKKVKAKEKKGYAEAVQGVRKKRAITRRTITSNRSTSKTAPVLWQFASGADAFGVFVDAQSCWVGNEGGSIFKLNHEGEVQRQFKLGDGVKCIVSDDEWLYAGCDDGKVYDLTGKTPRVAYDIEEGVDIYWVDIYNGLLGVSDADGNVLIANYEDEGISKYKSKGSSGWMIRCDKERVYHGHSNGITVYDGWEDPEKMSDDDVWECKTKGQVLFGYQDKEMLYVGTTSNVVQAITKQGVIEQTYKCDASVFSCATSEGGEYIFAGDNYSSVYCFNKAGERLWKLGTGCGSAYSMQYFDNKLYIVTTNGTMACIDASVEAIKEANEGTFKKAKSIKAPKDVKIAESTKLEVTRNVEEGVVVKCSKKGTKLRVHVISDGYEKSWNVQFPQNLREDGAMYVVEKVQESSGGGFYRAYGDIKRLEE